jgi:hypothetical protein
METPLLVIVLILHIRIIEGSLKISSAFYPYFLTAGKLLTAAVQFAKISQQAL